MRLSIFVFLTCVLFVSCKADSHQKSESKASMPNEITNFQTAIIYGKSHVYTIIIPKNWSIDSEVASKNHLGMFAFPERYKNGKAHCYIHSTGLLKKNYATTNIIDFINGDIEAYKKQNPEIKIGKEKEINRPVAELEKII